MNKNALPRDSVRNVFPSDKQFTTLCWIFFQGTDSVFFQTLVVE